MRKVFAIVLITIGQQVVGVKPTCKMGEKNCSHKHVEPGKVHTSSDPNMPSMEVIGHAEKGSFADLKQRISSRKSPSPGWTPGAGTSGSPTLSHPVADIEDGLGHNVDHHDNHGDGNMDPDSDSKIEHNHPQPHVLENANHKVNPKHDSKNGGIDPSAGAP